MGVPGRVGRVGSEIPALIGCHALGRITVVGSGAGPSVLWERGPQPQEGPPERSSPGQVSSRRKMSRRPRRTRTAATCRIR